MEKMRNMMDKKDMVWVNFNRTCPNCHNYIPKYKRICPNCGKHVKSVQGKVFIAK